MLSVNDAAGDCGYTPVSGKFAVGPFHLIHGKLVPN